ncbi:MAG TPA: POTRA domain-containing protein [Terriglobales bacterium]|nr:POTRA domain-containing protein [Terriglobales bacterium]
MFRLWASIALLVCFPLPALNQTAFPTKYDGPILTEEVVISGTTTLDNAQLQDIENYLTSRRIGNEDKEIRERIKDAFQQRGYFDADVTNLKVRPLDPLARPMPVRVEADVTEGVRYTIGSIKFTGNHAISNDELRQAFPIRVGDWFDTEKVRSGLADIRKQYLAKGYLNCLPKPDVAKGGDAQMTLTFDIAEGSQYRMGALQVIADKPEQADALQQRWKLEAGQPYDPDYTEQFLADNKNLLPADFSPRNDVFAIPDCDNMTVAVTIQIDAKRAFRAPPKEHGCEKQNADQ